jgi:hypothetical protein
MLSSPASPSGTQTPPAAQGSLPAPGLDWAGPPDADAGDGSPFGWGDYEPVNLASLGSLGSSGSFGVFGALRQLPGWIEAMVSCVLGVGVGAAWCSPSSNPPRESPGLLQGAADPA